MVYSPIIKFILAATVGKNIPVPWILREKSLKKKGPTILAPAHSRIPIGKQSCALDIINTLSNNRWMLFARVCGWINGDRINGSISHLYNPYTPED